MASTAYPGYGSYLEMSIDGVNLVRIAQLKSFEPEASKTAMIDSTSMVSPNGFAQKLPGVTDSGSVKIDGILIPTNPSQLSVGAVHGAHLLVWFVAYASDGSPWAWQGYVSEFTPFVIKVKNAITFSAKLTISGGMFTPLTAFDPAAFDPAAYFEAQV